MNLDQWMTTHAVSGAKLARRIGERIGKPIHPSLVTRYRRGRHLPSPEIMRAIYALTKGEVSAFDFIHGDFWK